MAYSNIESKAEAALIAQIAAAIAASGTLAALGIAVRGYWTDDVSGAADTITLPLVGVQASPNVPLGFRCIKRRVPMTITIATAQPEDRDRATAKAIYDAIREKLDETDPTPTALSKMQIEIADGGEIMANDEVNMIVLAVNAQMDVTPA